MYALTDGSHLVKVELVPDLVKLKAPKLRIEEIHVFAKELLPKRYIFNLSNEQTDGNTSAKIDCNYQPTGLTCHAEYQTPEEAFSGTSTLPQKMPYAFWHSVEAPTFDLVWASQPFAAQAERVVGHKTTIPLISIEDGDTPGTMKLAVEEIEQIEYLGREKISVLNHQMLAHKFRMTDPYHQHVGDLWMSNSGLLLAMTLGEEGEVSVKMMLTSYQGRSLK
jgi:hypothetical protein